MNKDEGQLIEAVPHSMYPLTKYLSTYFRADPLVVVDIGARGGLDAKWLTLGDSLKAYCFEADAGECKRLNESGPPNVNHIAACIAGSSGTATLYETRLNLSSGLYRTNNWFFGRLLNAPNADLVGMREVETVTLEQMREVHDIPEPDFIKLDVEGAELGILKATDLGGTFGFYSEVRFHREINGSPAFWELDQYAKGKGFMLYDLLYTKQSRKALPYKGPIAHWTDGRRFYAYTVSGQIMDGDALYFRDPLLFKLSRNQILKAACMFELWNLNDCAAELLLARKDDAEIDVGHCLDLLAGGSFSTYMENY